MYFVQRVTQCCFKRILVASCFIFDNICFIRNIYFLAHQSLFYIHCKILSSKYFSFTSFFFISLVRLQNHNLWLSFICMVNPDPENIPFLNVLWGHNWSLWLPFTLHRFSSWTIWSYPWRLNSLQILTNCLM